MLQYDNDDVSMKAPRTLTTRNCSRTSREGAKDSNPERKRQGYPAIEIVGWAEDRRAMTAPTRWAKELSVDGASEHTLNYDVRVLGHSGVLTMRAIAGISQLSAIKPGMGEALGAVDFNQGARYADFNPNTDHVSYEYSLAALVAGGIAARPVCCRSCWPC
ncbi:MAG: DUF2167 domain-containing protein [Lysobacterales bacterium]